MIVAVIIILGFIVLGLTVSSLRNRAELRHMAQLLENRDPDSNASIRLSSKNTELVRLACDINNELEGRKADRIVARQALLDIQTSMTHLSHDMRTPLTAARGYLQLMEKESDPEQQRHYRDSMVQKLDELGYRLDQFFVFTQVSDEEHELSLEPVDAITVLTDTLLTLHPGFVERGLTPKIVLEHDRCMVLADKESLGRIMQNLVANALQHGTGNICIQQSGTEFRFSNRTANPCDIDLDRLFKRFYKGDCSRHEQGGGLGLAIVSQLAAAMDASVEAFLEEDVLTLTVVLKGSKAA